MVSAEVASAELAASRGPGRPRSPGAETRALRAAFDIYAERGWAAFSFGEVARRARVGKGTLYLRWPTKASLVLASIEARQDAIADIDTGTVRGDLLEFARHMYRFVSSESGLVALRLQVEARVFPELRTGLENRAYSQPVRNARRIVRRAIERGELPASGTPTLVGDLIAGAVLNHVLATPPWLRAAAAEKAEEYLAEVVELVIEGAAARSGRADGQR